MKTIEPPFDLNLLRVLVALDRTRSVTRAAHDLDMSQSGFSSALARLRARCGDALFVRTAQGMEATVRAARMIEAAKSVLADVQARILDQPVFDSATARVEFRLAMTDVAEIVFLPRLLKWLQGNAPGVHLSTELWSTDGLCQAMESGRADLALGYFPDLSGAGFFQQRLYDHTYACIFRRNHPALRKPLTPEAYGALGHAVVTAPARSDELFNHFLDGLQIERRIVLRTPHHLSLPVIVQDTDLIATVPLATADRYAQAGMVQMTALPFKPPMFKVQQYWHRRVHQDPRARWLRELIAQSFNDDADEWWPIERRLYGDLRRHRAVRASPVRKSAG